MRSIWSRLFPPDYKALDTEKNNLGSWTFLERLLCTRAVPLVEKAKTQKLEVEDVWELEPNYSVVDLAKKHEVQEKLTLYELARIICQPVWRPFCVSLFFKCILTAVTYLNVYLIGKALKSCNSIDEASSNFMLFAPLLIILIKLMRSFFDDYVCEHDYQSSDTIRRFFQTLVYKKMINFSPSSRTAMSTSKIESIIDKDAREVHTFFFFFDRFLLTPFNLTVSGLLLFQMAGWSFIFGSSFFAVTAFASSYTDKIVSDKGEESRQVSDKRTQLISDVFTGIQVVKLYGWEAHMEKQIEEVRQEELSLDKSVEVIQRFNELFGSFTPFVTLMGIFYGIVMVNKQPLIPETAFLAIYLFVEVSSAIRSIPQMLKKPLKTWSAVKRILSFLNMEEAHRERIIEKRVAKKGETATTLKDANFSWSKQSTWTLSNLNLSVKQGQLVAVVGRVGSGKTALLSSLAGNLELLESSECKVVADKIGWCEQKPWIQNKTLRENILFDSKFDEQYYSKCIEACALKTDLELLEKGDETLIGERGVNLSGGQRARVGLARAVYQKADFYLLDDPLSAVDAAVARHIFNNVIGPNGMLSETTRLISVNSTQFLPECDLILVLNAFAQLIGHLSLLFGSFRACSKIHETLMHAVIRTSMSFFDVTPVGEILRRFNRDINAVDQDMRSLIIDITREASNALRLIVPLMLVLPSTSVPILMTAYTVYWFNRQYKNVVPTFYKLDRVVGAFQYTTIYDSWAGSATINGLHMSKDFIAGFGHRLDQRLQVNVAMIACHNWVRQRLAIAIYTLIGSWILLAVWSAQSQQITAGILALVITKGLDLCEYFPNAAQSYRWVQETAESIERINEYSEKEPEPMWIENKDESIQVPVSGNIEFRNVSVRYKSDSPLVLRSLTFKIESGQKIGVVGRTGAGKTTITSALFRLIELEEGEVLVGDVNIKRMGSRLRHHLTIIPQDPILFTGSVRTNLDPANQFKDEQLFEALERIGFLKRIQQLDNQLSHEIKEGGSNFSVGERQLFCLARALLRPTRFLVLDEASAHLDLETDHHIQQAIREHFAEATVLTIAHRLNTLANYDKIMVIDAGQLVEFDSFLSLLSNPDGYLTRLVNSKSKT
ncbi:hypothetical protein M3Y97_01125400 [Aphelenchoides bicaudatus]|nr:hypothetical protein M3Y97_01125400 [Aphelenchoides bicaudatus]